MSFRKCHSFLFFFKLPVFFFTGRRTFTLLWEGCHSQLDVSGLASATVSLLSSMLCSHIHSYAMSETWDTATHCADLASASPSLMGYPDMRTPYIYLNPANIILLSSEDPSKPI